MKRHFFTLDVFTGQALAGNPLAVVLEAQGLTDSRMQAIAREFNLSETVFVAFPSNPANRSSVRIFTPGREVPFAGHPTVGTAVLLGLLDRDGKAGALGITLEEMIGPVPCAVEVEGPERGAATFTLPRLPERVGSLPDRAVLALGLGLDEADIGFATYQPAIYSAGNPFRCVPLRTRDAVTRARPNGEAFEIAFGAPNDGFTNAFVYCADTIDPTNAFHARMFAPAVGVPEDPATGSAAAAFAQVFMDFEKPADGRHSFVVEQGDAMGRPSRITVSLDVSGQALLEARIGGEAVIVSEGWLRV
ncbi:MAG TPA: phenazine biosynthesis protein PhzF [Acetobacteraceae bacterium]|jgi:trans-2,3-dihydro-3-hydroxyanthranilate isomerase|nr:phenazine biosynthesis protein PhzF [Acetobacteraceae bacterium]